MQRELLLDTIVQNTPVAMVLVDPNRRVVFGNLAARKVCAMAVGWKASHSRTC